MRSPRGGTLRAMHALWIALALLSTATLSPVASAGTRFAFETTNATANEQTSMEAFDAPSVGLGDFDGDGHVEIVAHNDNQVLYVLSSKEARVLAEIRTRYPPGWTVRPINDPVVADVDGDGLLDIVAVNSAAYTCRYEYDPGASTSSKFAFQERWCRRADRYDGAQAAADGSPWVEDVDGDGRAEIFMNTEERGLFAWNADGSLRWSRDKFGGNAGPMVTDLEKDGRKEVIFFGDGGEVRALDARDGWTKWEFFASRYIWPASIPVAGSAADTNGNGKREVVFIARDATNAADPKQNHFMLFMLRADGSLKWRVRPSWGNPLSYTHPVLKDVDGDKKKDVIAMDWNTMGHKPGTWQKTGPANVFAYKHDGTLLWRTQVDNTWSNDEVPVADFDGDGALEVGAIGWGPVDDGVWYLDARTGAKEQHVAIARGWVALRGPIVADLNGNGALDWAVSIHKDSAGGGFRFYTTDARCRIVYGNWQVANACKPLRGTPGAGGGEDPPPPPGGFSATFRPVNGNEWWVQVSVTANEEVVAVDARANSGTWHGLTLRSWGDWAASFHVPDGSIVEFRARSESGEQVVSGGFLWPGGAPVGGGGGSFTASFENVRGNEWWIETDVTANQPLAGVDARRNGGSWSALAMTSWSSWARSLHAPAGTIVEFRARSLEGGSGVSSPHRWPP